MHACLALLLTLWTLAACTTHAADGAAETVDPVLMSGVAGPDFADLFDPSRARAPIPGEWLEYRLAFPVDPLENSLRTDPAPLPGVATDKDASDNDDGPPDYGEGWPDAGFFPPHPTFAPDEAWRILPIRLEVCEVGAGGCRLLMVHEGGEEEIYFPFTGIDGGSEFLYDRKGGEKRVAVRIEGADFEAEETRRRGGGYGFVRWFSPDVPFGVVRFATEHIDLMLVGMGGAVRDAGAFPLPTAQKIDPPLGLLYGSDDR